MSYIILILQYFTLSKIFVVFVIHKVIPDLFSVLICIAMCNNGIHGLPYRIIIKVNSVLNHMVVQ